MTAKDILTIQNSKEEAVMAPSVGADMHLLDVLPRLLDSPAGKLAVSEEGRQLGMIDESSLLRGIGRMIAPRDDCSVIIVECSPEDYSASVLAHAVEDTDAHLVDLLTVPGENGRLRVTMRIRQSDPTSAVRSLERYDYHVIEAHPSSEAIQSMEIATERLLSLQALMNV